MEMMRPIDETATLPVSLDERSSEILRRIVESYLETGEPIGSRNLSKSLAISLSPASVRNVMADLEQLGLIYAPHTSAGRLPTDQGLRFFVDALLNVGTLSDEDRVGIEKQVGQGADGSVDSLLNEASQMLSGLSQGAGLVIANKQDMRLKHIEFVALEPGKALVVLVGEDGSVENRLVDLPPGLPPSALVEASNYLNGHIRGKTLSEAREIIERVSRETQQEVDELTRKLVDTGIATWAGASGAAEGGSLIVHGHANLLQDVAAREDLERIRQLFQDLEGKKEIVRLIDLAEAGDGVRIFIGSENKLFSLSGSALVVAPWRDRQNRVVGALGIIGPTRLNYARVIPMVDYTAQLVGRLIK